MGWGGVSPSLQMDTAGASKKENLNIASFVNEEQNLFYSLLGMAEISVYSARRTIK